MTCSCGLHRSHFQCIGCGMHNVTNTDPCVGCSYFRFLPVEMTAEEPQTQVIEAASEPPAKPKRRPRGAASTS